MAVENRQEVAELMTGRKSPKTLPCRVPEEWSKVMKRISQETGMSQVDVMRVLGKKFELKGAYLDTDVRLKFRRL